MHWLETALSAVPLPLNDPLRARALLAAGNIVLFKGEVRRLRLPRLDTARRETAIRQARAILDDAAFVATWAAGRDVPLEQAIDAAMHVPDAPESAVAASSTLEQAIAHTLER